MIECTCLQCGSIFTRKASDVKNGAGKYCSKQCHNIAQTKKIECTCNRCGRVFLAMPSRKKTINYCSKLCERNRVDCVCKTCGKAFTVRQCEIISGKGQYCSHKCYIESRKIRIQCECLVCGKPIEVTPGGQKKGMGKYCSNGCRNIAKRGAGNIAWRGGKVNYRGENWYQQRKLAYARDGSTCQVCHRKPHKGKRQFDVHHIRPFREFNGDYRTANDLSNLITLCPQCHPKAEHGLIPVPKRLL